MLSKAWEPDTNVEIRVPHAPSCEIEGSSTVYSVGLVSTRRPGSRHVLYALRERVFGAGTSDEYCDEWYAASVEHDSPDRLQGA